MCVFVHGLRPDTDKIQFDIEMPKEAMDAEAVIVWAVSSEPPFSAGCEVYMIAENDAGKTSALVTCLTAPAEDTPMTMLVIDVHGEKGYEELFSMATAPEP